MGFINSQEEITMLVSTKGRYALRIMTDLAEHQSKGYIPLKAVASRQGISEKYLEGIIKLLVQNKFLVGVRGKGRLPPHKIPGTIHSGRYSKSDRAIPRSGLLSGSLAGLLSQSPVLPDSARMAGVKPGYPGLS